MPADTLDAYRRAGLGVFDLFASAEAKRSQLAAGAVADVDHATRCFLLCTWNAFALQTLGDAFVAADYAADTRTVGYVPPVTEEQALSFYGEVELWMGHGHEARVNSHCRLPLSLPAELPPFAEVEPCPAEHLQAMVAAAETLREHAEPAILDAERLPGAAERQLSELRALLASATNAAGYAARLYSDGGVSRELHARIERSVRDALASYYLAGQLAAMPELVGRNSVPVSVTGAGTRMAGPGERGFDPWCLTDHHSRDRWQRDPQARAAIDTLWSCDHDPAPHWISQPRSAPRAPRATSATPPTVASAGSATTTTAAHGRPTTRQRDRSPSERGGCAPASSSRSTSRPRRWPRVARSSVSCSWAASTRPTASTTATRGREATTTIEHRRERSSRFVPISP